MIRRKLRRTSVSYDLRALYGPLKVFTGRSHPTLAQEICCTLGIEPGRVSLYSFSDGENYVQIDENVRGADVFVVQPTSPPVNDNLMELLIMLDAFKRSSASRITAVIPYYGYARQDRKDKPRVPITSKLVADLINAAGADRVLTLDLHASQIQGFFNIPVDHLFAAPVIVNHLKTLDQRLVHARRPLRNGRRSHQQLRARSGDFDEQHADRRQAGPMQETAAAVDCKADGGRHQTNPQRGLRQLAFRHVSQANGAPASAGLIPGKAEAATGNIVDSAPFTRSRG